MDARILSLAGVVSCATFLAACGGGGGGGRAPEEAPVGPPVIESFQPPSDSEAAVGEIVVFSVTASPGTSCSYSWRLDGATVPGSGSRLDLDTGGLSSGTHVVSVDVAVSSGSSQVTSIAWRIRLIAGNENGPPVIASVLPAEDVTATRGQTVIFLAVAVDPDATDTLAYRWAVDGTDQGIGSSSLSLETASLALGAHGVEVTVSDGHDHPGSGDPRHAWTLTIEDAPASNRAPEVSGLAPGSPIRILAGTTIRLSVTAMDPDGDSLTYRWTVDGESRPASGASFDFAPGDAVGAHTVQVTIDDGRPNSSPADPVASWSIAVDPATPAVVLPEAGTDRLAVLPGTVISLEGSVGGDCPSEALVTVWSVHSGPGSVAFGDSHALVTTATLGAPGTYEIELRATCGSTEATDMLKLHLIPEILIDPATTSGKAPLAVDFAARHAGSGAVADDLPTDISLRWDFGDGAAPSYGPRAGHSFTRSGRFVVSLALVLAGVATGCKESSVDVSDPDPVSGAIIIDHTHGARDPAEIPAETIAAAKAGFKVFYGHTSHGLQILTGCNFVRSENPSLDFDRSYDTEGTPGTFFLEHNADLANPSWGAFDGITRAQLEKAGNDRNVVMWSWCTQLDWQRPTAEQVQTQYLDLMAALERDYPDVTFVYFTSATASGPDGSGNLRNEQVRTYCRDNGKVLFDFADIERWDDDGTYFPWVDDAANYYNTSGAKIGNWAQEWCARNPGECPPYPRCDAVNLDDLTCCAHTETLSCVRKGRAFWWLLAQLVDRP